MDKKGPFLINAEKDTVLSWCTCGFSSADPFCDGSHRDHAENKRSLKFSVSESGEYALCSCKQTKTPPFCDGSHIQ